MNNSVQTFTCQSCWYNGVISVLATECPKCSAPIIRVTASVPNLFSVIFNNQQGSDDVTVAAVESVITLCRLLRLIHPDMSSKAVQEALKDLASDEDVRWLIEQTGLIPKVGQVVATTNDPIYHTEAYIPLHSYGGHSRMKRIRDGMIFRIMNDGQWIEEGIEGK